MATNPAQAEPVIPLPPPLALSIGATMAPRSVVERIVEHLIAALDTIDGDVELESNGEDEDGDLAESDPYFDDPRSVHGWGPGCLISDDDQAVDDMPCDPEGWDGV